MQHVCLQDIINQQACGLTNRLPSGTATAHRHEHHTAAGSLKFTAGLVYYSLQTAGWSKNHTTIAHQQ
jgi:hypothetical protein